MLRLPFSRFKSQRWAPRGVVPLVIVNKNAVRRLAVAGRFAFGMAWKLLLRCAVTMLGSLALASRCSALWRCQVKSSVRICCGDARKHEPMWKEVLQTARGLSYALRWCVGSTCFADKTVSRGEHCTFQPEQVMKHQTFFCEGRYSSEHV